MTAPLFSLAGKKALVTGANSGIGKAVALALAEAGADVGVNYVVNAIPTATAVSLSLGGCEPGVQQQEPGVPASFQQLLKQALAEGQTWSAATGDQGADACQDGATKAVDFPASIPEMVAMGGTGISKSEVSRICAQLDADVAAFMDRANPWAARAIAEKLLEAAERGMWAEPIEELIGEIRSRYLALEDDLEGATA